MSEPTVPTPPAGYDPRPEASAYPSNQPYATPRPTGTTPVFQQVYIEKSPEQLEGEKLAKTSTILGIISIYFLGVVLGPMAIIKAAKAEKLGVDSTVGQVTGWIGTIVAALSIIFTILYIVFFAALISTFDSMDPKDAATGGFSTQDYDTRGGSGTEPFEAPGFEDSMKGSAYEDLSPAERESFENSLNKVARDAATQIN